MPKQTIQVAWSPEIAHEVFERAATWHAAQATERPPVQLGEVV